MAGIGTPTNTEEFIRLYVRRYSNKIRGIMGLEAEMIHKNTSILDVGCGIGNNLFALYANGFKNTVGLDFERQLAEYARGMVPEARLVVGNAEQIPFKGQAFDCVMCYDLLEHVLKPEKVLDNISRVLKEKGILYMSVANGHSINDVLFRLGGKIIRGRSSHVQKFRRRDVETLLRNTDFEIESICEIRGCILDAVGPAIAVMERIPFSNALKKLSRKVGNHMSIGWELKAAKRRQSI